MAWREVEFGQVVQMSSGKTPSKSNPDFWNGEVPWITASSMGNIFVHSSDEKITKLALEAGMKYVKKETPLLLVRGSILHQKIPICIPVVDVTINQDVKALSLKSDEIDNDYFIAWLLASEKLLLEKVEFTGIGAGKLDTQVLNKLKIPVPEIITQKKIGSFAKSLIKKIELNKQINETLEAMAQAIFKEWFIDFGPVQAKSEGRKPFGMDETTANLFPDSFEESEIGPIPKGWRVVSLSSIMDFEGGTQPPAEVFKDAKQDGYVRLIQIRDYYTNSHLTYVPDSGKLRKTTEYDIMIARYGASVGRICWGLSGAYNVALVKVVPLMDNLREFLWCYLLGQIFQDRLIGMSNRSAQSGFNKGDFASFSLAVPADTSLLKNFESKIAPMRTAILKNKQEIISLIQARELLLPKLIGGEFEL